MGNLGARLEKALLLLSGVKDNRLFADIGSDHAFLSIEAVKRGFAKSAIASDINKMPLEKGRENAQSQNIYIDFILSDGFDALEDKDLTSAAVCGMGGELIGNMLLRSKVAKKCQLILQPMSAQEDLRKILWDNGFEIKSESFVIENGKAYTLMFVIYTGENTVYSFIDLYLGKERENSPEFSEYCKKIKNAAEKRRLGIIATKGDLSHIDRLIEECQRHIINF